MESCSPLYLPQNSYYHSQNEGLVCAGEHPDAKTNCVKWNPASGNWTMSHTLKYDRYHHVSWATASGVYLIGGYNSPKTSEKVKSGPGRKTKKQKPPSFPGEKQLKEQERDPEKKPGSRQKARAKKRAEKKQSL